MSLCRSHHYSKALLCLAAALVWIATMFASTGVAQARVPLSSTPVAVHFDNLLPGDHASESKKIVVPVNALITDVGQLRTSGSRFLTWTAKLCDSSGSCVMIDKASEGKHIVAGTYLLTISVDVDEKATPDLAGALSGSLSGRIDGSLTLAEGSPDGRFPLGHLAYTGADAVWLVASAALLACGGGWVVVWTRRRQQRAEVKSK